MVKFPFVQISRWSPGDLGNFRSTGDLRRFWTLQIIHFEAMLEKHQKWYELENVMGGIFEIRKDAVKILW